MLQVIIFIMEPLKANGRISGMTGEKCDAENTCVGITYLLLNYNLWVRFEGNVIVYLQILNGIYNFQV